MNLIAVITTIGSVEDARKLATALVERRLAACAQISQIESVDSGHKVSDASCLIARLWSTMNLSLIHI